MIESKRTMCAAGIFSLLVVRLLLVETMVALAMAGLLGLLQLLLDPSILPLMLLVSVPQLTLTVGTVSPSVALVLYEI